MKLPKFSEVAKFHGHVCPGIVLGYRMSVRAMNDLMTGDNDSFTVICETARCPIDAVEKVTGCSLGKGSLILKDCGKSAFTYINHNTGKALRVTTRSDFEVSEIDPQWDALRAKLMKGDATDAVREDYARVNDKVTEALLALPDDEFLVVKPVKAPRDEKHGRSGFVNCATCGEKVIKAKAIERSGLFYCAPCLFPDEY